MILCSFFIYKIEILYIKRNINYIIYKINEI